MIRAVPANCAASRPDLVFSQFHPNGAYSGMVAGNEAVHLWLDKPGKCKATTLRLFAFMNNSYSNVYQAIIKMPFALEEDQ